MGWVPLQPGIIWYSGQKLIDGSILPSVITEG